AGVAHTCALIGDGTVQCWGRSDNGQLGNGSMGGTTQSTTPVAATISGVSDLAVGQRHNCAVVAGGAVQCWGRNNSSQLGDGGTTTQPTPVAVVGLPGAASHVAAGQLHSCALLSAGTVYCWGDNASGQLGNSSTTPSPTPVQAVGLSGITAITSWGSHSCAI